MSLFPEISITCIELAPSAVITKAPDGKHFQVPIIYVLQDGRRIPTHYVRQRKKDVKAYMECLPENPGFNMRAMMNGDLLIGTQYTYDTVAFLEAMERARLAK